MSFVLMIFAGLTLVICCYAPPLPLRIPRIKMIEKQSENSALKESKMSVNLVNSNLTVPHHPSLNFQESSLFNRDDPVVPGSVTINDSANNSDIRSTQTEGHSFMEAATVTAYSEEAETEHQTRTEILDSDGMSHNTGHINRLNAITPSQVYSLYTFDSDEISEKNRTNDDSNEKERFTDSIPSNFTDKIKKSKNYPVVTSLDKLLVELTTKQPEEQHHLMESLSTGMTQLNISTHSAKFYSEVGGKMLHNVSSNVEEELVQFFNIGGESLEELIATNSSTIRDAFKPHNGTRNENLVNISDNDTLLLSSNISYALRSTELAYGLSDKVSPPQNHINTTESKNEIVSPSIQVPSNLSFVQKGKKHAEELFGIEDTVMLHQSGSGDSHSPIDNIVTISTVKVGRIFHKDELLIDLEIDEDDAASTDMEHYDLSANGYLKIQTNSSTVSETHDDDAISMDQKLPQYKVVGVDEKVSFRDETTFDVIIIDVTHEEKFQRRPSNNYDNYLRKTWRTMKLSQTTPERADFFFSEDQST